MSRILASTGVAVLLAFAAAPDASATPQGAPQSLIGEVVQSSVLQQVHGCHDDLRRDDWGRHRHVGRHCRRIEHGHRHRGKRYWHRGARCDTYCVGVGPLRVCDRNCD
ncbi:MAG: hypothetical protein AB7U75_19235 [Hyphomicrobiaceae bacterium]